MHLSGRSDGPREPPEERSVSLAVEVRGDRQSEYSGGIGGFADKRNGKTDWIGPLAPFSLDLDDPADDPDKDGSAYREPELAWDEKRAEEGYDCPRCGEWIPIYRQRCAACGLDTETLRSE